MTDVVYSLNKVNLKVLLVLLGFEDQCRQVNITDGDINYETQEKCSGF